MTKHVRPTTALSTLGFERQSRSVCCQHGMDGCVCKHMPTYELQCTHRFTCCDNAGFEQQSHPVCCKRGTDGWVCIHMPTCEFQCTHPFTCFDNAGFERQGRSLCCKRGMHGAVCNLCLHTNSSPHVGLSVLTMYKADARRKKLHQYRF